MRETDLYPPIKAYFEARGYNVKAEVKSCDVVACKPGQPLLVIELKLGFTLQLMYQAVDRLSLTPHVYLAVAKPKRGVPRDAVKLCRRLGLGLIVVGALGGIQTLAEPALYTPRPNARRQKQVIKEFDARKGDPNLGGSASSKLMTAYKQDALRCLAHLNSNGTTKLAVLREATKVDRAAHIMRDNYYGWFTRATRGCYQLTSAGQIASNTFGDHISALT